MNRSRGWVDGVRTARDARGQALVEFSLLVPVFLVILLGMLEFGFALNDFMSISYASREGARAGAALASGVGGGGTNLDPSCVDGVTGSPRPMTSNDVDPLIIAAVERVLKSPGSMVALPSVGSITIYKADSAGNPIANASNVWRYTPHAGPLVPCQQNPPPLDFTGPAIPAWPASSRRSGSPADELGISISYTYHLTTPLAGAIRLIGGSQASTLPMSDRTVMAIEPTN